MWHFQPPELNVHISNPEVRLAGNPQLTFTQDKLFKLVQTPEGDLNIPTLLQMGKQTVQSPKEADVASSPKIIQREVTMFSTTAHGSGFVTTGWSFRDGSGGEPFRQYCYYALPNHDHSSTRVDIASDGARLSNVNASLVPDLEMAVAKCQWWHH
jgi:hypothetical protein